MSAASGTCPKPPNVFLRLLPACVFLLALGVLVTVMYGHGYGSLPPSEQRYVKTKKELDDLRSGSSRAGLRENWLRVADEFQEIYDQDPNWSNRPAALFRKAECLRGLARRSGGRHDYQNAAVAFEKVAMRHAQSRLADDALLNAAEIKANFMDDQAGSLRLLTRIRTQYARGDMAPRALELERTIATRNATGKTSRKEAPREEEPRKELSRKDASRIKQGSQGDKQAGELTRIAWQTLSRNQVRIVVELDRKVRWQARRTQAKSATAPSSLVLDFQGAVPSEHIRAGARVADSPLNAVRVDAVSGKQTRLFFDFANLVDYETRVEQEPFRIILDARAKGSRGKDARQDRAVVRPNAPLPVAAAPSDLASQLALNVESVFIDAGHGGKDPGATHNGLVEREVALDVARRAGALLRKRGLDVQYSREKDVHLPLHERPRLANRVRADIFVSVHVNASTDAKASGFETFYLDIAGNAQAARLATIENAGSDMKMGDLTIILADFMLSARTQESQRLARAMQKAVVSRLGKERYTIKDGGTRAAPLHVLIGAGMPAILVELGYSSNREEARRLASSAYRQSLAEGIAEGVLAYRDALSRKRTVEVKTKERRSRLVSVRD